MKRRYRIVVVLFVLLSGVALILMLGGRDIPEFTADDLVPERIRVAEEDDALRWIAAAEAALNWKEPWHSEYSYEYLSPEWVQALESNEETLRLLAKAVEAQVPFDPVFVSPFESVHARVVESGEYVDLFGFLEELAWARAHEKKYEEAFDAVLLMLQVFGMRWAAAASLAGVELSYYRVLWRVRHHLLYGDHNEVWLEKASEALDRLPCLTELTVRAAKCEYQTGILDVEYVLKHRPNILFYYLPWLPYSWRSALNRFKAPAVPRFHLHRNRTRRLLADLYRQIIDECHLPVGQRQELAEVPELTMDEITSALAKPLRATYREVLPRNAVGQQLHYARACLAGSYLRQIDVLRVEREATRLIVAIHRYQQRYGQLPAELGALVPEFLPEVPRDPFDGQPFRYRPELGVVYSIGVNLVDDGGAVVARVADEANDPAWQHWRKHDLVFDVWRAPPAVEEEQ